INFARVGAVGVQDPPTPFGFVEWTHDQRVFLDRAVEPTFESRQPRALWRLLAPWVLFAVIGFAATLRNCHLSPLLFTRSTARMAACRWDSLSARSARTTAATSAASFFSRNSFSTKRSASGCSDSASRRAL